MVGKKCLVHNCNRAGRKVGSLGDIDLIYCTKHEDIGVRVLNFLINSKFRWKFTRYMDERREDLFKRNEPSLCKSCNKKLFKYVNKMIKKVNEIEK